MNSPIYSPLSTAPSAVVVDPIGVRQLPSSSENECRKGLAKTTAKLAAEVAKTSSECRDAALQGGPLFCGPPVPDLSGHIAATQAKLVAVAQKSCDSSPLVGSPGRLGYASCPPPCGAVQFTCVAGTIGALCTTDASCDTAPGAGDGSCGDWVTVASCLGCITQSAVFTAFDDAHRLPPPPGQGPSGFLCQQTIGRHLVSLTRTYLAVQDKCQDGFDAGKKALPATACSCVDADPKGKRADIEAKVLADLDERCDSLALLETNTCAPGPAAAVADCMTKDGRDAVEAIANVLFPETVVIGSPFDDSDGDTVVDCSDNCPDSPNPPPQLDGDSDGVGDICDNCPMVANPDQHDNDNDLIGDACDPTP